MIDPGPQPLLLAGLKPGSFINTIYLLLAGVIADGIANEQKGLRCAINNALNGTG